MIITKYTVHNVPANLTLALVTDFHEGKPDEVLSVLNTIAPDVIAIAGDTFERRDTKEETNKRSARRLSLPQRLIQSALFYIDDLLEFFFGRPEQQPPEEVYRFLSSLSTIKNCNGIPARVYLSRGNHEWEFTEQDFDVLKKSGITYLDNSDVQDSSGIYFGGLPSVPDEEWLDRFHNKSGYKILLSHHPEYYKRYLKMRNIDLILSGHAHGGQIRVFGRGVLAPGQGVLPKYHHGFYDNRLIVSSGCTNTASAPRWGNPCEIVVIEMRQG